ncbi:MAG: Rpn family recombination-promoting nuclease/putative transposase [Hespellia sp.]|nr:Rpn family recombination-promoting nuclease/putative transposase [Hespellia sp.]
MEMSQEKNVQNLNVPVVTHQLENLNLLDDFLLNKVSSSPEWGEPFFKELLDIILKIKLKSITIVPQKVYYGITPQMHGTRIDVYVEEQPDAQEVGSIYDVEAENGESKKKELPKRVRFYHAKIDMGCLKSGDSYKYLKQVFVIIISPFDPFGLNRMVYTIRNQCVEVPTLPYNDGASTLFLYTKGTEGNPPADLKALLHYMEDTNVQNATNEQLRSIQTIVDEVKSNKEVSIEYMKIAEREEMIREEAAAMERINTEKERQNASTERKRADAAEARIRELEKEIETYKHH